MDLDSKQILVEIKIGSGVEILAEARSKVRVISDVTGRDLISITISD